MYCGAQVKVAGGDDVLMQLGVCDCFGERSALEAGHLWNHTLVSTGFTSLAKVERIELNW